MHVKPRKAFKRESFFQNQQASSFAKLMKVLDFFFPNSSYIKTCKSNENVCASHQQKRATRD